MKQPQPLTSHLVPSFDAKVLFQNKRYSIEKYINTNTDQFTLAVIKDQTYIDYVMIYDNGNIAFDNSDKLPKYIKKKVRYLASQLPYFYKDWIIEIQKTPFQGNKYGALNFKTKHFINPIYTSIDNVKFVIDSIK